VLQKLSIRNFALIREIDLDFRKGFTIITGETGAGKSILLGAIHLILGDRAETSVLKDAEQKCIIEARFNIKGYDLKSFFLENDLDEEAECILRREISQSGKSRSFINDTPVNLQQLKTLGAALIDIHSQHDTLLLNNAAFRIQLIDGPAGCIKLRNRYADVYQSWKKKEQLLRQLIEQEARISQEKDYLSFQLNELLEANLQSGELQTAEDDFQTLSHASEIRIHLEHAIEITESESDGIIVLINKLNQSLKQAARFNSGTEQLLNRAQSIALEFKDLAFEINRENDKCESDPQKLEELSRRIDTINRLIQKHRVSSDEELIILQNQLETRLAEADSLSSKIEEQQATVDAEMTQLRQLASELHTKRAEIAGSLEKQLIELLSTLGMPSSSIKIEVIEKEQFDINGKNDIRILFSANKGSAPAEISKVASGGELSRLMLCLKKIMASSVALPTIIFDEIDTGVSGAIADGMGEMLHEMGKDMQVISITHLPQIASKGSDHLKVQKSGNENATETRISRLTKEQRIDEIAGMLSGKNLSDAARSNAKALLKIKD
jgi:DNA repair protein RecN (Recombination protein N)